MNNWRICWFSRIILLGILIFKVLTARRLYKSFGVKGVNTVSHTQGLDINFRLKPITSIFRHEWCKLGTVKSEGILI
jgi:hypothetical protein